MRRVPEEGQRGGLNELNTHWREHLTDGVWKLCVPNFDITDQGGIQRDERGRKVAAGVLGSDLSGP